MNTPAPGTPAANATTTPQKATILNNVLAELEKVLSLAADPAAMALLPARYQGYAAAALIVESVIMGVAAPLKQAVDMATAPSAPSIAAVPTPALDTTGTAPAAAQ